MSLLEKGFWFALGALALYLWQKNNPDFQKKEDAFVDSVRNNLHDYLQKLDPQADDQTIANEVMTILPEK